MRRHHIHTRKWLKFKTLRSTLKVLNIKKTVNCVVQDVKQTYSGYHLQYIQILNHYVTHLKLVCYMSILSHVIKKKLPIPTSGKVVE